MLASDAARKNSCAQVASDHEVSVKAFAEELKAVADATQVLRSETGAAEGLTYSLFKVSASTGVQTTMDLKGFEVVTMVKRVTGKEHSAALIQLASRTTAVMKFCVCAGEDPFAIDHGLDQKASSEASHKSYCVDELAKASVKREDLETQVAMLCSMPEAAVAKPSILDGEFAELQADSGTLSG